MSGEKALTVEIARLPHGRDLMLPAYATEGAAGMDLAAALPADGCLCLVPGARAAVPTGVTIALPEGYEAQLRPRSGLARHHGLTVLNSPGTIDRDYRGEIEVILINLGAVEIEIRRGMRIAQLVVAPVCRVAWQEVTALAPSARGAGGFGSSGLHDLGPG